MAENSGAVGGALGGVRTLLRLEGLLLFAAALALYAEAHASWQMFLILFLVPDLSMAAYVAGPRIGAVAYNAAHSTLGPLALVAAGYGLAMHTVEAVGLIWAAHVGVDRALGFGLKYGSAFRDTHLGRIGSKAST